MNARRADSPLAPPSAAAFPRPLLVILLAGACVRVALWLAFDGLELHDDERDYNSLAVNLVLHGEFAHEPGQSTSIRPPLYPAFVAGIYWLAGVENWQAVRLVQALLSLLTVVLLYRLGVELYSRRVALWLAGLFCFYPSLLGFNNLLLTEVLFTFLLCLAVYVLALFFKTGSVLSLFQAGVCIGLASLTRSVLWLFPLVLCLYLLCVWRTNLARRFLGAGLLFAAFAATIAPWTSRNTMLEKTFTTIDSMGGRNFMMGNYRHTPLYRSWAAIGLQGELSWDYEVKVNHPRSEWDTQGKKDKVALRRGIAFVLENPGLTLRRDLVKFFQFWGLERELLAGAAQGYFGGVSRALLLLLTVVIFGSYALALLSAVFGVVLAAVPDRRVHWMLMLIIAYVCGMHTLTFGHSRYHLPLMPLVLIFSASALAHAKAIWRRRRTWSFALAAGIGLVFVGGWLWEVVLVDLDRYLTMVHSVGR
jgi:4-amino-4-deoxy-L-arabinose transferase-like glycosyltransferase